MSQQNPTIIVGHLDDSELTKSIDKLVNEVANKTTIMAGKFTSAIGKMQDAMKDFAVTQKVSVDLMKEAWRDMSKSFDAMVAAQSASTGGGKGGGKAHAPNTIGALEQEIAEIKQERKEMKLNSDELRTQNTLLERRKNLYKEQTTSPATKRVDNAMSMSTNKLDEAQRKLRLLEILQRRYAGTTELSVAQQNRLARAIQKTKEQIDKLKPKSLKDVLGMDANSIDQIAAKMRALKMVRIDPNNAAEVKSVGDAYAELKRKQAQLMGQNIQLTHSNNYLAQSFGYIRNRIVYALTLGDLTNFVKQLYEIRGQYELLERSLGVLVGSFEKGTQIFNELNEMAIKSPFTLIELGTAAKQLTAYNFAANEVVDTTRRLADISAALGVPMERLTYNLGQIKAQGVLNARDARDFANAGLAIVPMLAKMYTEQKTFGDEMVTTAKVYDMMSKKMVTYSDVLKVLYRVTDEGGKFFDFQAKQADTLRVQMANLTLAYNNILNEIGSENQGLLTAWVSGLKTLLKNWKGISRAILTLVTTLGTYKAVAAIVSALNSRMFVGSVLVGLRNYILGIKNATGAMATFNAVTRANPIAFLISALVAAIGYFALFNHKVKETTVEMERFGENASKQIKKVETLGKVLAGIEEGSSTYKRALSDLNQIVSEYGVTEIKNRNEINSKIQETIQLIKEEGKERQYANNIAKGEERYLNATGDAKTSLNEGLSGLEGWFGTTSKVKKEILDNTEAITDIASSIIEENINLVVNKTGEEAYKGLLEIRNKVRSGLKNSGLSDNAINFILNKGYINAAIKDYRVATEEHERYNQKIKGYYDAATKATQSTMTFTEKVNANARALRNNTEDALSLYNRIYDIVKIAKENHTINFDIKLSAEKPPKWMLDKSLPELQRLAERFTAIAQSGGHAEGYNRESTYERGLMYASAARIKQEEEERKSRQKDKKTRTKQSDEIAKAIKNEISLVKELQGAYDTLTKKGDSHANAIAKVQDLYGKTINLLNKDMDKFGLPRLDLSIIKGNNHNEVLAFFERLRDVLESKGLSNLERMEAVEGVVKEFRLKADTYNLDMITKGLNNELGKLKDEYELAVELDANPELGGIFADMMGLDKEQLSQMPKDFEGVVERLQKIIDRKLGEGKFNLVENLNKASFNSWLNANKQGTPDDDALAKSLESIIDYANKVRKDETNNQIKEWDKMLEKYAEYEYKKKQIFDEYNKEMEIARKKGAKIDILRGIENKRDSLLAELDFNEFVKSPEWITATGNLAGMSEKAIKTLIDRINEYKSTAKNLTPKQIKEINKALKSLHNEQHKANPFKSISNMLAEARERMENFDGEIESTKKDISELSVVIFRAKQEGEDTEEQENALKKLRKRLSELNKERTEQGKISATSWTSSIKETLSAVQSLVGVFNDLGKAISGIDENNSIDQMFSVFSKAADTASIGSSIGGAWGAVIGALVGGATASLSMLLKRSNELITESVEKSERNVKSLEVAYKGLEDAIKHAYGTAVISAKQVAITNKEMQLAELKRQLTLEASRKEKDIDQDKITELRGQIKDLELDIKNSSESIVNELLGISSVGDAMEQLMSGIIDNFRSGSDKLKDIMKDWNTSINDMIAEMVKKMYVTKILTPWFETQWSEIQKDIDARANALKVQTGNKTMVLSDYIKQEESFLNNEVKKGWGSTFYDRYKAQQGELVEITRDEWIAQTEEYLLNLKKQLKDAQTVNEDDIKKWAELLKSGAPIIEDNLSGVKDFLRELGLLNDKKNSSLSALQQGIQGITEDTAGALESYMNIVSQRMFEQGSLIREIRDVVVGFDADVQTATQAQMLLQLQQSYAVQMAIQGILEGWNNPSGQAVRVELVS